MDIKKIPDDVYNNYIYMNDLFVLVRDPKSNESIFHYTIWSLTNIKDITEIDEIIIKELKNFIKNIKTMNIFDNEKIYICYPPTHICLHLHIVPINYISHRPLEELYNLNHIDIILDNIQKIKLINQQIDKSIYLNLNFKVGVIQLNNINNIIKINDIKIRNNLNYIVVIRKKETNHIIEHLINNHININQHLFINEQYLNYHKMIKYNYYDII